MPIRVIPVLDLQAGRAVRAIGGDRAHYRPLATRLHVDSDPVGVARGYVDALDPRELYVADLDAIGGTAPALATYRAIHALGVDLWVDAGIRDRASLAPLLDESVATIVVGLETVRGPDALAGVVAAAAPGRLVFSLDLRAGSPLIGGDRAAWGTADPFTLARVVVSIGIRRLLLLDLERVGTGRGTGSLALLGRLRAAGADLEIAVGGGISRPDEVRSMARAGADAVLIGSALHDGRIGAADLASL